MFMSEWKILGEITVVAIFVYVLLVVILRITGKRTTSKMNNFDWIVTVALGSMVSTVILIEEVLLLEGLVGITSLILLQYAVTWLAARSSRFEHVVKASPRLLYYGDEFQQEAMRSERVTQEEIISWIRLQGHTSLDEVVAIVMETNAELSIIVGSPEGTISTLDTVDGAVEK